MKRFPIRFQDLKIRTRLLLGFGAVSFLALFALATSSYVTGQYRQSVEAMEYANNLKTLLDHEDKAILQLLGGDEPGAEIYSQAHNESLKLREALGKRAVRQEKPLLAFIGTEQQINRQLFATGGGLFREFSTAQKEFIDKNIKHVRRLLGYKQAWVLPGSAKDGKALRALVVYAGSAFCLKILIRD